MANNRFHSIFYKLLSVLVAFIIWITVANVDDYKTTKKITGIDINFINGEEISKIDKVYEVPEGTTVDIIVKGRRRVVEGLTADDFVAEADLSKLSLTSAATVVVTPVSPSVARDVTISYLAGDMVSIKVEDKVSKQFQVNVVPRGEVKEGYAIRSKTATPNLITVSGANALVSKVNEVVTYVDVTDMDKSVDTYSLPVLLDSDGQVITSDQLELDNASIGVNIEILKTKTVPVNVKTVGTPKEGYDVSSVDYQPTEITVVGNDEELARIDELAIGNINIYGKKEDVEQIVNIADYLPTGVILVSDVNEISIKVNIEQVEEKTFKLTFDDLNFTGKADGLKYSFEKGKTYEIKVTGLSDKLESLKFEDLMPTVDVTGLELGTHKVKVTFKNIDGVIVDEDINVDIVVDK